MPAVFVDSVSLGTVICVVGAKQLSQVVSDKRKDNIDRVIPHQYRKDYQKSLLQSGRANGVQEDSLLRCNQCLFPPAEIGYKFRYRTHDDQHPANTSHKLIVACQDIDWVRYQVHHEKCTHDKTKNQQHGLCREKGSFAGFMYRFKF